jgi:hypothetical protein
MPPVRWGRRAGLLILAGLILATDVPAAGQVPPDADWRTLDTEHFRIHFTPGVEPLARRAGDRAERAHALLSRTLVPAPRGRIDLVVTDAADVAGGYATILPTNRIVVHTHPPIDVASLSFYDDWLELVILHELVHIFHIDHAGGAWEALRRVFGRFPLLFPQAFSPTWLVEGLATYYESLLTGAGRVRGTHQEMVLRTATLEDRFFDLGRVAGVPATFPGGSTPYVYGSMFLAELAHRHGPESLAAFVREYGGQHVPYGLDRAARRAFGVPFTAAWREWEAAQRVRYRALADSLRAEGLTEPELLTPRAHFDASHPRYAPVADRLVYATATGREEPALREIDPDGVDRRMAPVSVGTRASWAPDGTLVYARVDFADPYRPEADLYRVDGPGRVRQITRGARLREPAVSPDGRTVAAIRSVAGASTLLLMDLESGRERELTRPDVDVAWGSPAWAPDGARLAAVRWRSGGWLDVVILDTAGAVLREITSSRAVDDAPTWTPDGRHLLFSSDRTGITNLYAVDLATGTLRQVTNVLSGAFQPSVSANGRWIAFSLYTAEGYRLARIPFDPGSWREPGPARPETLGAAPDPTRFTAAAGGAVRPYSPFPAVLPAAWLPIADWGSDLGGALGLSLYGADPVGRHTWSAGLLPYFRGSRVSADVSYRYAGLGNPVADVTASQEWSVAGVAGAIGDEHGRPVPSALLLRERDASLLLTARHRRVRGTSWVAGGGELAETSFAWSDPEAAGIPLLSGTPVGGTLFEAGFTSARVYPLSISPEDGVVVRGRLRARRQLQPGEGAEETLGYVRATAATRAYPAFDLPGFARHVLALRLDGGADSGALRPGFGAGGAAGGGVPVGLAVEGLGRAIAYPVRGYPEGAQVGDRVFSASAEYRVPIALIERGFARVPFFFDRIWGDVFVDAGAAWCPGVCERHLAAAPRKPRPMASVGAELSLEVRTGYHLQLPIRAGAAFPFRDVGEVVGLPRPSVYLRLGRAF